jgi:hydrogenase nickel incorporation protein HypA/HybF
MHEFSMIQSIMELVKSEMEKRHAIRVMEINLEVGELSFLSHDALQFSFGAIVENEPKIEKDALKIISVPAEVMCSKCGYSGPMKNTESAEYHLIMPVFQCPKCGGSIEIIQGKECIVRNLKMEVE